MRHGHLSEMVKGWFVGNFDPCMLRTRDCEVAVKQYTAGSYEAAHHHRIAMEITVIVSGTVRMMGCEWSAGDIIVVEPSESTDFLAITDTVNVVVKVPGANNDKYID
jgi:hypothetical protein